VLLAMVLTGLLFISPYPKFLGFRRTGRYRHFVHRLVSRPRPTLSNDTNQPYHTCYVLSANMVYGWFLIIPGSGNHLAVRTIRHPTGLTAP
jgi:hypothetical protein